MTFTIALSLPWLLVVIAALLITFAFWATTWQRYNGGTFSGLGWLWEIAWMLPVSLVLLVWATVEFFR